jgi:hypothetical protein
MRKESSSCLRATECREISWLTVERDLGIAGAKSRKNLGLYNQCPLLTSSHRNIFSSHVGVNGGCASTVYVLGMFSVPLFAFSTTISIILITSPSYSQHWGCPQCGSRVATKPRLGPQTSQSKCRTPIVMMARSPNENAERQKHPTDGGASKRQRQNNHSSLKSGRRTAPDSGLDACAARLPVVVQDVVPDHVGEDLDGVFSMIRCSVLQFSI